MVASLMATTEIILWRSRSLLVYQEEMPKSRITIYWRFFNRDEVSEGILSWGSFPYPPPKKKAEKMAVP